jgi:hypothetical protein
MKPYQSLLAQIAEMGATYGVALQPAGTLPKIGAFRNEASARLSCSIPEDYCEFLAIADGLDWNGLVIYASERTRIVGCSDRFIEGFIQANLDYRESGVLDQYLLFAEDGTVFYALNLSEQSYRVILMVGLTVLDTFSTFDELITTALQEHL